MERLYGSVSETCLSGDSLSWFDHLKLFHLSFELGVWGLGFGIVTVGNHTAVVVSE